MQTVKLWMTIAMLYLGDAAFADISLTPHQAKYLVTISVLGGELTTRLDATTDSGYFAKSKVVATGVTGMIVRGAIRESSEFSVTDGSMLPMRYVATDSLSSKGHDVEMNFDWGAQTVATVVDGKRFTSATERGALDRVTVQYALMHDLTNNKLRSTYLIQESDKIKTLTVRKIGYRHIRVPFGEFDAVGIQHQTGKSSRVTTLWCVAELGYLPVVIEQHQHGEMRGKVVLDHYKESAARLRVAGH